MSIKYNPFTEEFENSQEIPLVTLNNPSGRIILSPSKIYGIVNLTNRISIMPNFDDIPKKQQVLEFNIVTGSNGCGSIGFPSDFTFANRYVFNPAAPNKIYNFRMDPLSHMIIVNEADRV